MSTLSLPLPDAATVLLVDDEPSNLTVLSQLLEPHFRVLAANSGERALRLAAAAPAPDLILLDIMMPGMDGYAVLRSLRDGTATRDIPIIFISAMDAPGDEEFGLGLGAVDYISKPIQPSVVLARVRTQMVLVAARRRMNEEKRWLEQEVARRLEQVELVQDLSLTVLAELAEARDNDTGHHIQRTQAYVGVLAEQLSATLEQPLPRRQISLLVKASPLHDIGKVGIPDHILLKPGKLTPGELSIMRTHAEIGAHAIERAIHRTLDAHNDLTDGYVSHSVEFLLVAREIALTHHEYWDGNGYPEGLNGDAIPLSGRLMALADVFDALISARVYKPPMSPSKAREYILSQRGRQFDPLVVACFEARFDDFVATARRYSDTPVG